MNNRILCIEKLIVKNYLYQEICEWMIANKFTDSITAKQFTRSKERAEFVYNLLKENRDNENIILLYFEWSLLPTETIKVTCTTQKEEKIFTYGL